MNTITGTIFNIMRFAVNDGPGIRTTIFFKGCPLRCSWCHNPESMAAEPELMLRPDRCIGCQACLTSCPHQAISLRSGRIITDRRLCKSCGACVNACPSEARAMVGKRMTVEQVLDEIEQDVIFYRQSNGGVTLSGGEPLAQPEFATAILKACKSKSLHTALDTSGYASPAVLQTIHPFVDLYLFDLKTMDEADHKKYTGVALKPIVANLHWLCRVHANIIIRIPLIPGINDAPEQLERLGQLVSGQKAIVGIHLLPYHCSGIDKWARLAKDYQLAETSSPKQEKLQEIATILRTFVSSVTIGG